MSYAIGAGAAAPTRAPKVPPTQVRAAPSTPIHLPPLIFSKGRSAADTGLAAQRAGPALSHTPLSWRIPAARHA